MTAPTDPLPGVARRRAVRELFATDDRLIRLPEVKSRVGLSKSEIYRRIRQGTFPAGIRLGPRTAVWRESEVLAWIAATLSARGADTAPKPAPPSCAPPRMRRTRGTGGENKKLGQAATLDANGAGAAAPAPGSRAPRLIRRLRGVRDEHEKFGHGEWGDLYRVLKQAFPSAVNRKTGLLVVTTVAGKMGVTVECAYKWLRANKLPARQASKAIKLSRGLVRFDDFQDLLS